MGDAARSLALPSPPPPHPLLPSHQDRCSPALQCVWQAGAWGTGRTAPSTRGGVTPQGGVLLHPRAEPPLAIAREAAPGARLHMQALCCLGGAGTGRGSAVRLASDMKEPQGNIVSRRGR